MTEDRINPEAEPWAVNSSGFKTLTIEEYETRFGIPWQRPLPQSLLLEQQLHWGTIAEAYIDANPLWYDRAGLWWSWSHTRKVYEMIDETDLLIMIDRAAHRNSLRSSVKAEILEAFRREARKNNPKEPPKTWVQFKDKVFDLNTGDVREPTSNHFLTNSIPWTLSDAIETPRIDYLLKTWSGDDWPLLKQLVAFCCLRDYPLHRIFLLIGSGSNGKGTYLRLLNKFLGKENVASTEMDLLIKNQFHITKLHKKLACQMSETNFTALSNTSMLKRLSGGDLVGFEYKNKLPFDDYNYAKIIIATNSLPVTHDKTDGFYRRWLIIDFPNRFTEKGDPLTSIPDEEFSNLANWSCQELQRLLKEREFHNERTIEERKERYEARSNPLKAFIEDRYEKDVNSLTPASSFYDDFSSWCLARGFRGLTYQVVRTMMKDEGFEYEKQRVPFFDNPISVVVGLKTKVSVPAVPAVPPLLGSPSRIGANPKPLELLEQLEQSSDNDGFCLRKYDEIVLFIRNYPVGNAFDLEQKFGQALLSELLKKGDIIESPHGTYRII